MCFCQHLVTQNDTQNGHIMCEQQASTWCPGIHRMLLLDRIVLLFVCICTLQCVSTLSVFSKALF